MNYIELLEDVVDDLDVCLELVNVLLPKAGNKKTQKTVYEAVNKRLRIAEGKLNRTKSWVITRSEQFVLDCVWYEIKSIRKQLKKIMEELNND